MKNVIFREKENISINLNLNFSTECKNYTVSAYYKHKTVKVMPMLHKCQDILAKLLFNAEMFDFYKSSCEYLNFQNIFDKEFKDLQVKINRLAKDSTFNIIHFGSLACVQWNGRKHPTNF